MPFRNTGMPEAVALFLTASRWNGGCSAGQVRKVQVQWALLTTSGLMCIYPSALLSLAVMYLCGDRCRRLQNHVLQASWRCDHVAEPCSKSFCSLKSESQVSCVKWGLQHLQHRALFKIKRKNVTEAP